MEYYTIFGGRLASELVLPDLVPMAPGHVDWTLRIQESPPVEEAASELVGEHIVGRWTYRLSRHRDGLRLCFANHYTFDILGGGAELYWYVDAGATLENVRALVLGPVLAIACHLRGTLSLHGSAVAIGGQGVVFLADKYNGKSTLGLALTLAGAGHLTDDTAVVDPEPPVRVRPGVHSVRLWQDSSELLATAAACSVLPGKKDTLTELPQRLLCTHALPLGAVYMLRSVLPSAANRTVERILLQPGMAAVGLVRHLKLPQPLVGHAMSAEQFKRAAAAARVVPVYDLAVVRDFQRLPEVVRSILAWHAGGVDAPAERLATALDRYNGTVRNRESLDGAVLP